MTCTMEALASNSQEGPDTRAKLQSLGSEEVEEPSCMPVRMSPGLESTLKTEKFMAIRGSFFVSFCGNCVAFLENVLKHSLSKRECPTNKASQGGNCRVRSKRRVWLATELILASPLPNV